MKLEYHLTEEDLFSFNGFHQKHSPVAIKARRKSIASCAIAMFLTLTVLTVKDHGFSLGLIAIFLVPSLFVGYLTSLYLKSHSKRYLKKAIQEGKNISLGTPVTLEIADNEISSNSALGEAKIKWDIVERIEETEEYVFIYISALDAIIIPKKIVKSDVPVGEIYNELQKMKK